MRYQVMILHYPGRNWRGKQESSRAPYNYASSDSLMGAMMAATQAPFYPSERVVVTDTETNRWVFIKRGQRT